MAEKTGLRFGSKAAEYRILVRPEKHVWGGPNKDVLVEIIPPLTAEFGFTTAEYSYENPLTGGMDKGADVRGFLFDVDQQAEEKGWSDEDVQMVVKVVRRQCQIAPDMCWLIEKKAPVPPWPKYDTAHHNTIPELADNLGLVAEALAYEQQTKARESVIGKLEEILARQQDTQALEVA